MGEPRHDENLLVRLKFYVIVHSLLPVILVTAAVIKAVEGVRLVQSRAMKKLQRWVIPKQQRIELERLEELAGVK